MATRTHTYTKTYTIEEMAVIVLGLLPLKRDSIADVKYKEGVEYLLGAGMIWDNAISGCYEIKPLGRVVRQMTKAAHVMGGEGVDIGQD